ncbi:hypothetical protein [Demequina sp. NBRC 110056]|uniref:hypothetical protein n=1 Tax=Demequina sp. NBRC 110056 TaxID=1570345 RepID=UPI001356353C|nr:hypothetical protein [Demequina sp. NBRC 110056]
MSTDRSQGEQPTTGATDPEDTHPAKEEATEKPVPHGDGEPRETDDQETPSD